MIAGILKEIKIEENRVSMTPAGVEVLKDHGHTLLVEKGAGSGSGFEDKAYVAAGAEIVKTAKEIYDRSDMVMHVKEPMPSEYKSESRENFRTKRLLNCNSFPIQMNDNGVKFCSVLPPQNVNLGEYAGLQSAIFDVVSSITWYERLKHG